MNIKRPVAPTINNAPNATFQPERCTNNPSPHPDTRVLA
jgi:hypothetical protein